MACRFAPANPNPLSLPDRPQPLPVHKINLMLSRNQIKYLNSLKIKKFRNIHGQFLLEGDRIICDALRNGSGVMRQLIATGRWLEDNRQILRNAPVEPVETDMSALERISTLESPPPVIAVMEIPRHDVRPSDITDRWSLALDHIQDPGNLGTIIRTADWFGIRHIFCSGGCADCYNPKAVQASMGAILNVAVVYTDLSTLLAELAGIPSFTVYGTFTEGLPVYGEAPRDRGIIVLGSEARGISDELIPLIGKKIAIPPGKADGSHVESLNVASAAAVTCAILTRRAGVR